MSDGQGELGRFLHWGPFASLTVSLLVFMTTWVWWPTDASVITSAHFGLYLLLNLLSVYNYVTAVLVGPGWLPRKWQPMHHREAKFLQYCKKCDGYKAPRSHHCRRCDRCVMKMDHHCPWINHCVGWSNQSYFVYFLFFYMMSNLHAAVVLCCSGVRFLMDAYQQTNPRPFDRRSTFYCLIIGILSFALSVCLVICLLKLLLVQLWAIVQNKTEIEQWIHEKARQRRKRCSQEKDTAHYGRPAIKPFVYPYNLGWWSNLGQVFNLDSQHLSGGIDWPVRKGCDPFALTREQLAQKADKRLRTRTFRCIKRATGYWLPLFSQGLVVTACLPFSDEPRLCLEPNDLIRVTRLQTFWLFGERVIGNMSSVEERHRPGATRGWFPRCCAIDITEELKCEAGETTQKTSLLKPTKNIRFGKLNVD